ncbi:putative ferric-chelate reductase 1 [Centropristis striata]|uniref:putative ferric-chelate reductase 1 n=1 Tax=Centropristis striata TaxID=184440 RepID=UPI0027DED048|nr:putative ferric-chelate reductase 1 [Centropristis striata]
MTRLFCFLDYTMTSRQVKDTPSTGCCILHHQQRASVLTLADLNRSRRDQIHSEEQKLLNKELYCDSNINFYSSGMDRGLILLVAALVAYVSPGVRGTEHLSFANGTEVNITRAGCGETKLCVETPDDCDPAGNTSCLFASVVTSTPMAPNGTTLSVEVRGYSMGYVAFGLTMMASEGTTMLFICAQNSSDNGTFFFRTMDRNNTNNMLTPSETRTKEIRGMVTGNVIKCEFDVPYVNASNTRSSADTTFTILLGTGSFDGNAIGAFNVSLDSGLLNLANPASNISPMNATATPSTTAGSGAVQPHAVLLLLSVLGLSVLLRA